MDNQGVGPKDETQLESLEGSNTVVEQSDLNKSASESALDNTDSLNHVDEPVVPLTPQSKPPKKTRFSWFKRFNVYLTLFILLLIVGIVVVVIAATRSHNTIQKLATTSLSQSTLDQIANSDETVGNSSQVLNVQSNAVFAGTILVRGDLQVAGKLSVGSSLSLSGITVSGNSAFQQVQVAQNLSVGGDESLLGQLTVQKNLTVNGSGTFNGALSATQLTVSSLQLSGNLTLTHHVVPGGPIPTRTNGDALGDGGTTSVNGSDTAGTLSVNTGSNPTAGCFATINFVSAFISTPHVLITPIGPAAASVSYYVNRTTTNFSICTNTVPPASSSFAYDYWAVD